MLFKILLVLIKATVVLIQTVKYQIMLVRLKFPFENVVY